MNNISNLSRQFLRKFSKEVDIQNSDVEKTVLISFATGLLSEKDKTEKVLLDLKNKYKAWLSEEKTTKIAKTPNYIKEVTLQSKIDLIEEIERKLCQK